MAMLAGAAIFADWIGETRELVRRRDRYWVAMDHDPDGVFLPADFLPPEKPLELPWLRRVMGDVSSGSILYSAEMDPQGRRLKEFRALFPEAQIRAWRQVPNLPHDVPAVHEDTVIGDARPEVLAKIKSAYERLQRGEL